MAEETKFADSFLDLSNLPSSMDELLKSSGSTNAFNKGKIVEGTIVAKRPDGALVDIGYKAEGFVPASEFLKFDEANVGDKIDVTGISKGHGYAGVIKRFGQGRTPTTHGGGPVHRHAGSMGSSTDPSRIFPGKKQAGHMGVDQVTVQNLDVVKVDPELNMIVVRGAIPGPKGGIVYIKSTVKKLVVKKGDAGVSTNPQKASGRNPQKASARK